MGGNADIQRWSFRPGGNCDPRCELVEAEAGGLVYYSDHLKVVADKDARIKELAGGESEPDPTGTGLDMRDVRRLAQALNPAAFDGFWDDLRQQSNEAIRALHRARELLLDKGPTADDPLAPQNVPTRTGQVWNDSVSLDAPQYVPGDLVEMRFYRRLYARIEAGIRSELALLTADMEAIQDGLSKLNAGYRKDFEIDHLKRLRTLRDRLRSLLSEETGDDGLWVRFERDELLALQGEYLDDEDHDVNCGIPPAYLPDHNPGCTCGIASQREWMEDQAWERIASALGSGEETNSEEERVIAGRLRAALEQTSGEGGGASNGPVLSGYEAPDPSPVDFPEGPGSCKFGAENLCSRGETQVDLKSSPGPGWVDQAVEAAVGHGGIEDGPWSSPRTGQPCDPRDLARAVILPAAPVIQQAEREQARLDVERELKLMFTDLRSGDERRGWFAARDAAVAALSVDNEGEEKA
ncbi:MAG: hypothetical protein J0H98_08280 [Solirubrobacterales bacterium]|nr:hypothetical protein [Solirubrobacterales bacterium]